MPFLFLQEDFQAQGSVDLLEPSGEKVYASRLFAYDLPFGQQ